MFYVSPSPHVLFVRLQLVVPDAVDSQYLRHHHRFEQSPQRSLAVANYLDLRAALGGSAFATVIRKCKRDRTGNNGKL